MNSALKIATSFLFDTLGKKNEIPVTNGKKLKKKLW